MGIAFVVRTDLDPENVVAGIGLVELENLIVAASVTVVLRSEHLVMSFRVVVLEVRLGVD